MDTKDSGWSTDRPDAALARIGGLCESGIGLAGVDGAGVSMIAMDGSPQPVLSTDDLSALVEDLQFTLGEGPCFDATATRTPVLISDLAAHDEAVGVHWPAFLDEAVASGIRAVFAFPLAMGAITLGTMDLYRRAPGPLDRHQLASSLTMADAIGLALLDDDPLTDGETESTWVRMTVHRAAGMVMVQTGQSIEDALLRLRAAAYGEGRSVNDLAADVLEGRLRFEEEE